MEFDGEKALYKFMSYANAHFTGIEPASSVYKSMRNIGMTDKEIAYAIAKLLEMNCITKVKVGDEEWILFDGLKTLRSCRLLLSRLRKKYYEWKR